MFVFKIFVFKLWHHCTFFTLVCDQPTFGSVTKVTTDILNGLKLFCCKTLSLAVLSPARVHPFFLQLDSFLIVLYLTYVLDLVFHSETLLKSLL